MMSNVVVNIAGRPYTMQCPDGEEDHLKELAKLLDTEVGRIRQSVGAIGDIRQMEAFEAENQTLRESRNAALGQIKSMEDNFSRALDIAAEKLEELAK
jgi:cell division protein ZapA